MLTIQPDKVNDLSPTSTKFESRPTTKDTDKSLSIDIANVSTP